MDDLAPIIEQIGALKDSVEVNRWELAEMIHDAFSEFPQYERGLLSGLCQRLKYTPANLYNYRNAWDMKTSIYVSPEPNLSVSHYAKIYNLKDKYDLDFEEQYEYLKLAEQERWSVAQLAKEVVQNHDENTNDKYLKSIRRLISLIVNVLNDPENDMDEFLRANLYDVKKELEKIWVDTNNPPTGRQ